MELLQGFLFTSRYLLGRSGNTDLFYLFAAFVLCFYAWKRHDKLSRILKTFLPFLILSAGMAILYPWADGLRCMIFALKMLCNVTILFFAAYNCRKWNIIRFVDIIVWIHAIETFLAILLPNSGLWVIEDFSESADSVARLRLFYMNAGTMAFASGLVLVLLVYQLLTKEVIWRQLIGVFVMAYDLYLSYGLGGIGCAAIAVVAMLLFALLSKEADGQKKRAKNYLFGCVFVVVVAAVLMIRNQDYLTRIKNVLSGSDIMLQQKLLAPLEGVKTALASTHYLGVGFGNANVRFALDMLGIDVAYPNSFIRIIVEGGIFGIALTVFCVVGLGYFCFRYGTVIDKALFLYITIYQVTGGYFTDPANFLIYGWIVGDCVFEKIRLTGTCRLKEFLPKAKKQLRIAQIGHKRIPSREGGVEIVVEEISKRVVQAGHQVTAYNRTGNHVSGAEYNLVDYDTLTEYEGIKIVRIPTIQKKGLAALVYSFFASVRVTLEDYDVVHYHAEGPCAFLWLPTLAGIRTVATIHGLDWARSGKWGSLASTFIKFGEKVAAEYSDELIVLSKHLSRYFWENYHRQTRFIPNGVNRPVLRQAEVITEKWGLRKDEYILFLGRLTSEKGIHYLIEAYNRLETDKKLVVAGGSSDTDQYMLGLKELAKDNENILFTNFVQGRELEELFSNAYFYCIPSDLEGMPISLLEAMSYGNCCLISDIPECTEVTGIHAMSFQQGDVDDLEKAMRKLLDNPKLVERYREDAADYICDRYRWDEVAEKTMRLYLDE